MVATTLATLGPARPVSFEMMTNLICKLWCFMLCLHQSVWITSSKKQILADVTSNKLTREHDGSFGLWSYHGVAKQSHATKTTFIYNADLLTPDGQSHTSIASTVYPAMGLTSDQDQVYQEYLILQSKVAGIDGFIIEWGFMNHSSDIALQSYLKLAEKHAPFKIAVNWCDHWLVEELKNKTQQEVVQAFHKNLMYLMDTLYSSGPGPGPGLYHNDSPVLFLFGGGLTSAQFRELLAIPLTLPPGAHSPIWLGSYLNFAATPELWAEWGGLLNGTFGWAPYVKRPTPANMSEWDFYGTTDDAVQYQMNVSNFGRGCVSAGGCALWCGSVSPGFDNRGCAGWGRELRYIPRQDHKNLSRLTYDAQWEYHIRGNTSAEWLIVPTLNDFSEATPILALVNSSYEMLYSTAKHASVWKGSSIDSRGVPLPSQWYQLYKEMQFYNMTPGVIVQSLGEILQAASLAISRGSLDKAQDLLKNAVKLLNENIKEVVKEDNLTLSVPGPSLTFPSPPVIVNGSYIVNKTSLLFVAMAEEMAFHLRKNNFKGLLRFQYQVLSPVPHCLRVVSSSAGRRSSIPSSYVVLPRGPRGEKEKTEEEREEGKSWRMKERRYLVKEDRSEVCKIVVDGTERGVWKDATVGLCKENQSWDHSARRGSDLVFLVEDGGEFAIRNISLHFTVFSKR